MAKHSIVKMLPQHIVKTAKLHSEIFHKLKETRRGFKAFMDSNRFGFCAINKSGAVNGYVVGTIGGAGGYLNWIAVSKSFRGCGLGSQLMRAFEQEAAKRGVKAVVLDTRNIFKSAIKLYLDCGYSIFGCQLAGNGDLMIRMSKTF